MNGKSRRILGIIVCVIAVVAGIYAYTWVSAYVRARASFAAAEADAAAGDIAAALKGGSEFNPATNAYVRKGGYQLVVEIWKSPWAIPKPRVYRDARDAIDTTIQTKMSARQGLAIVKQYARLNRRYLDKILLRVADLLGADGDSADARSACREAAQLFPQDDALKARVETCLQRLEGTGGSTGGS